MRSGRFSRYLARPLFSRPSRGLALRAVRFTPTVESIFSGGVVRVDCKEGDWVRKDSLLMKIETAKGIMNISSELHGRVKQIYVRVGQEVPKGSMLVRIADASLGANDDCT